MKVTFCMKYRLDYPQGACRLTKGRAGKEHRTLKLGWLAVSPKMEQITCWRGSPVSETPQELCFPSHGISIKKAQVSNSSCSMNSTVMLISLIIFWTRFSNDFLNPTQEWCILPFNVKKPSCETEEVYYSFKMGVGGEGESYSQNIQKHIQPNGSDSWSFICGLLEKQNEC